MKGGEDKKGRDVNHMEKDRSLIQSEEYFLIAHNLMTNLNGMANMNVSKN